MSGRGQAWFARAQRILDGVPGEHVERGYLLIPAALLKVTAGEHDAAEALANRCTPSLCSMRTPT